MNIVFGKNYLYLCNKIEYIMNEYKLIVLFLKKEKLWLEFKRNLIQLLWHIDVEDFGWRYYIKEAFLNNKNSWISEIQNIIQENHHVRFSVSEIMWNIMQNLCRSLSSTQLKHISNIIENYKNNATKQSII